MRNFLSILVLFVALAAGAQTILRSSWTTNPPSATTFTPTGQIKQSGNLFIDPASGIIYNSFGTVPVIDPFNQQLDGGANLSLDWNNRTLNDFSGNSVASWGNGTFLANLLAGDGGGITGLTNGLATTNFVRNATVSSATNAFTAKMASIQLHTNYTATLSFQFSSNTISFSGSKSDGFNDIQAMFHFSTNSLYAGLSVSMDDGVHPFEEQLVVTNPFCHIYGSSPASCIWFYDGPTNIITMQDVTNCLQTISGTSLDFFMQKASLLFISTNKVAQGGIEQFAGLNVELDNFSIVTKTNMFCYLIGIDGGDHTTVNNVFGGGPVLWYFPSYFSGFTEAQQIPEPNKANGFLIGQNQPELNHCRVFGVANGVVAMGDSFLKVNDFNAIALDYSSADGATPYPVTSELSLQNAILIPKSSQIESITIDGILTFDCWNAFYFGNGANINILDWRDQNAPNYPGNIEVWRGAGSYASIQIFGTGLLPTAQAYTNDAASGFYLNPSANAFFCDYLVSADGNFEIYDGANDVLQANRNMITWSGIVVNDVVVSNGHKFSGNSGTFTNGIAVLATNRLVFSSVSSFTNTLGREATAIVTAGTSVALQDTNGVSIATIGTIATLDVLVPMHVNMRLAGTGVSAILY